MQRKVAIKILAEFALPKNEVKKYAEIAHKINQLKRAVIFLQNEILQNVKLPPENIIPNKSINDEDIKSFTQSYSGGYLPLPDDGMGALISRNKYFDNLLKVIQAYGNEEYKKELLKEAKRNEEATRKAEEDKPVVAEKYNDFQKSTFVTMMNGFSNLILLSNKGKRTRLRNIADRIDRMEFNQEKFEKEMGEILQAALMGSNQDYRPDNSKRNDLNTMVESDIPIENPAISIRASAIVAINDQRYKLAVKLVNYINEVVDEEKTNEENPKVEAACALLQRIIEGNRNIDLNQHQKVMQSGRLGKIYSDYQKSSLADLLDKDSLLKAENLANKIAIDAERQLAFKLADMGQNWRISNADFFGHFYKTWKQIRGGENADPVTEIPEIHDDVLNCLSQKHPDKNEYQPVGNCSHQARANFLFLVTQNLSGNAMEGKTILQVNAAHVNHSYTIVTKLTADELQNLKSSFAPGQFGSHGVLNLEELKKADPSAYIIDSWRMGVFNQPKIFLHWKPFSTEDNAIQKRGRLYQALFKHSPITPVPAEEMQNVHVVAIGVAGHPEKRIAYTKFNKQEMQGKPTWERGIDVDTEKLKSNEAWQDFTKRVYTRQTPSNILKVMAEKVKNVITYKS